MDGELIIAQSVRNSKGIVKILFFFIFFDIIILYIRIGDYMKKTKIICSVGPACESVDVMTDMVYHGMNCARINLSHADYEGCLKTVDVVRQVRRNSGVPVAIMYDTKGPEFRTLDFEGEGITINVGNTIWMVKENVLGNSSKFGVNHPEAIDSIEVGNHVLVDNALLDLEVIEKEKEEPVHCHHR